MTNQDFRDLSLKTLAGASALEAADIARHAMTGKGQSWLPNSAYKNVTGIPGNFKTWITSGPTPAAKAALAGVAGYQFGNWAINQPWADKYGFGRQDLRGYGQDLNNWINSIK
jgi:hypothetical protein